MRRRPKLHCPRRLDISHQAISVCQMEVSAQAVEGACWRLRLCRRSTRTTEDDPPN